MAGPPTFSVGETLTASQMNAVGLWKVTGLTVSSAGGTAATVSDGVVTIGTSNTSITVSNAFSDDFANYRIEIANVDASIGGGYVRFNLGSASGAWYGSLFYDLYTGANSGYGRISNNAYCHVGILGAAAGTGTAFDIQSPKLTKRTNLFGQGFGEGFACWFSMTLADTTAYTAFTITPSSGTLTGGTIRVYGYRN